MFLSSLFTGRGRRANRRTRHSSSRSRQLRCEQLEDRRLLAFADFELSSLLPANGGNGSNGFVINGITDSGLLGYPWSGSQPLGDVNGDGIDDFFLAAPGTNGGTAVSQAYIVFGRAGGGFPAELDLTTLNGSNGYVIDGVSPSYSAGSFGGGAGDMNHDGIPDIAVAAAGQAPDGNVLHGGRTFVLYGGSANLTALDAADGLSDGRIELSSFDAPAADGTHGFVINGYEIPVAGKGSGLVNAAGDVNGDQVDDLLIRASTDTYKPEVYVIFGRDSTVGNSFSAAFELSSLLAANGGDGSDGFIIPPLTTSSSSFGVSAGGAGDINHDGIGDIFISDSYASPSGRTYAGQVHVIFGQTRFAATFDTDLLNGNNGFTVNGKTTGDNLGQFTVGPAGDINGDSVDDVVISAFGLDVPGDQGRVGVGGAYVLFGKNTASAGKFPAVLEVSTLNGSNGFVMYGATLNDFVSRCSAAGDVNGDGYDDVLVGSHSADPNGITRAGQSYIVYGRPRFGPSLELASLLAANGGDGSAGYALNGFVANGGFFTHVGIGDVNHDGFADVRVGSMSASSNGLTMNGQAYIVYGKPSPPPTKFYVVNDATRDQTYEYLANGGLNESYNLSSGNTAPRGVASTIAGDKVWVVDANRKVYVYNTSGGLLGSWSAGSLPTNATVEDISVEGECVWIVDAKSRKVYHYSGAANYLSGSWNSGWSFGLNSGNANPKGMVTDGTYVWVVNDSTTDKVFKYTVLGSLVGSWTIASANSKPTGITIDPSNVSNMWIVDSGTKRVYQYNAAASRSSGSQAAAATFALAAGNTNPQGIADPPAPSSVLAAETRTLSASVSPASALHATDADLAGLYDSLLTKASSASAAQGSPLVTSSFHGNSLPESTANASVARWATDRPLLGRLDDKPSKSVPATLRVSAVDEALGQVDLLDDMLGLADQLQP